MHRLLGFTFFLVSLAIAGGALHLSREQPARADYAPLAECISQARYQHPLDDQHQELVNAMYACGIYKLPVG